MNWSLLTTLWLDLDFLGEDTLIEVLLSLRFPDFLIFLLELSLGLNE